MALSRERVDGALQAPVNHGPHLALVPRLVLRAAHLEQAVSASGRGLGQEADRRASGRLLGGPRPITRGGGVNLEGGAVPAEAGRPGRDPAELGPVEGSQHDRAAA